MSISRYRNTPILDRQYYGTQNAIDRKDLDKIKTFKIRISSFDRLDTLAAKYLGSGEYWWVIAELNDMEWAWDFTPGEIIEIPVDIKEFLKLV